MLLRGMKRDRIDTHIEVPRVEYDKLSSDRLGEPSAAIQAHVEAARQIQRQRFASSGTQESQKANPEQGSPSPQLIACNADIRPLKSASTAS